MDMPTQTHRRRHRHTHNAQIPTHTPTHTHTATATAAKARSTQEQAEMRAVLSMCTPTLKSLPHQWRLLFMGERRRVVQHTWMTGITVLRAT